MSHLESAFIEANDEQMLAAEIERELADVSKHSSLVFITLSVSIFKSIGSCMTVSNP